MDTILNKLPCLERRMERRMARRTDTPIPSDDIQFIPTLSVANSIATQQILVQPAHKVNMAVGMPLSANIIPTTDNPSCISQCEYAQAYDPINFFGGKFELIINKAVDKAVAIAVDKVVDQAVKRCREDNAMKLVHVVDKAVERCREDNAMELVHVVDKAVERCREDNAIEINHNVDKAVERCRENNAMELVHVVDKAVEKCREDNAIEINHNVDKAVERCREDNAMEIDRAVETLVATMKEQFTIFSNRSTQELTRISSQVNLLEQQSHFEMGTISQKNVVHDQSLAAVKGQPRLKITDGSTERNTRPLLGTSEAEYPNNPSTLPVSIPL